MFRNCWIYFVFVVCCTSTQIAADGIGVESLTQLGKNSDTTLSLVILPGQTQSGKVEITNNYPVSKTLLLSAKDGVQNSDGALSFIPNDQIDQYFGAWTKLDKTSVTLASMEKTVVTFTTTVPENVIKKEVAGVIAAQETIPERSKQGEIQVNTRFSKRVHVLTSKENLSLNTVLKGVSIKKEITKTKEYYTTIISVENTGNLYSYCSGELFEKEENGTDKKSYLTFFAIEPGTQAEKVLDISLENKKTISVDLDCYPYHSAQITIDKSVKTINEQSKNYTILSSYNQTIKRQGKEYYFDPVQLTSSTPLKETYNYASSTYTKPDRNLLLSQWFLLTILGITGIISILVLLNHAKHKQKT